MRFGLALDTLQNWEQRCNQPDPAARLLLKVIELWPASSALARHGRGASEDMYNAGPFDRGRGSAANSIAQ
jgi:hypothetical protein